MTSKKIKNSQAEIDSSESMDELAKIGQKASDNYVKRNNQDTFIQITDKISNDILSYTMEGNNDYLGYVISSVKEGMPPIVSQESALQEPDVEMIINELNHLEDTAPDDYVPKKASVSKPKDNGDVEVSVI